MEWKLTFRDDGILEIKAFGNFTNNDLIFMAEQIISDPRWMPGMDVVADFRSITSYGMGFSDLFLAGSIHTQFKNMAGDGRIAVILLDKFSLFLSYAYEIIVNMYMEIKLNTFEDYDAGIEWISRVPNLISVSDHLDEFSGPFKYH